MKDTKFQKGCTPWNKGKIGKRPKGLKYQKHKDNPTSFKKGHKTWNAGKSGYQTSKKSKGYINSSGYLVFYINGKEYLAHRLIWEKYHGTIPEGYLIHHKDRNKLNNDIFNLELTTRKNHSKIHYAEKKNKLGRKKK